MDCVVCLPEWKFNYSQWVISKKIWEKYKVDMQNDIINAASIDDIPKEIFEEFKDYNSCVIYRDDDILIFEDVEQDHPWHILVCPANHLDIQQLILDNELMIKIYSACDMMVKLVNDLQEAKVFSRFMQGLSFKKSLDSYGVKHAHMHLICDNDIDVNKIRENLYFEFYKESDIYKKYKGVM